MSLYQKADKDQDGVGVSLDRGGDDPSADDDKDGVGDPKPPTAAAAAASSNAADDNDNYEPDSNNNKPKLLSRRKKKRKLNISEQEVVDESFVPSYQRKTARGGYAATAGHRLKISQANKGKQPWNTGKNRSQQDIDKIRAAVKARNERKLAANLQTIGMSPEEYVVLKKQLKLMRENVRRYKNTRQSRFRVETDHERISRPATAALKKEETVDKASPTTITTTRTAPTKKDDGNVAIHPIKEDEKEKPSNAAKATLEEEDDHHGDEIQKASDDVARSEKGVASQGEGDQNDSTNTVEKSDNPPPPPPFDEPTQEDEEEKGGKEEFTSSPAAAAAAEAQRVPRKLPERETDLYNIDEVPEIYRRDFEWTPHRVFGQGDVPLQGTCPTGGPGGLICCEACTALYCNYLKGTYNEIEDQKITKAAADLEAVTHYLQTNQERLTASVRAAHRRPPPSKLGRT